MRLVYLPEARLEVLEAVTYYHSSLGSVPAVSQNDWRVMVSGVLGFQDFDGGASSSFHPHAPSAMARYFFAIPDLPSTILRKPAGRGGELFRASEEKELRTAWSRASFRRWRQQSVPHSGRALCTAGRILLGIGL